MYALKQQDNMEKIILTNEQITSYRNLIYSLRQQLYSANNCTKILGKNGTLSLTTAAFGNRGSMPVIGQLVELDLGAQSPFSNANRSIIGSTNPGDMNDPSKWWRIAGGTSIRAAYLKIHKDELVRGPVVMTTQNRAMLAAKAELILLPGHGGVNPIFRGRADTGNVDREYKLRIQFLAYFNAGTLFGCFDPQGAAANCTYMGGTYNPADSVASNMRCEPDLTCFMPNPGITSGSCPLPCRPVVVSPTKTACQWCNLNRKNHINCIDNICLNYSPAYAFVYGSFGGGAPSGPVGTTSSGGSGGGNSIGGSGGGGGGGGCVSSSDSTACTIDAPAIQ
jgi:uncharacterized membrane protein YgcG